ncbi:MAG: Txe/YoeB family addiction module toxin [Acidobacteriota bacterium]
MRRRLGSQGRRLARMASPGRSGHDAVFATAFLGDLEYWVRHDRKLALRTLKIVDDILRHPFEGLGKPEPLRGNLAGLWSRRLSQEHRIVYEVADTSVRFLQCRYHYGRI